MVRYLGPIPSVNVILDKCDSLCALVPTFDVMIQRFYRESQGRGESLAHYIARLEGKWNKIHVKHLNRVSDMEKAGCFRDHLFYGIRKTLWEAIHAKCDKLMNDYMVLMWAARKAKGQHKQEKHNSSYASMPGIVNDVPSGSGENTNPDPKTAP